MYLKCLKIKNFRKFDSDEQTIQFVDSIKYKQYKKNNYQNIDVSPATTLIIGKNNVGKTTVINALLKLVEEKNNAFGSNDFNFKYLKKFLDDYKNNPENTELPYLNFTFIVGLDKNDDLLNNLLPIIKLSDFENTNTEEPEIEFTIKYELKDEQIFRNKLDDILTSCDDNQFQELLKLIDESYFIINYYDSENKEVKNFKIQNLIDLKVIRDLKITNTNTLKNAFNKIFKFYQKNIADDNEKRRLEEQIKKINKKVRNVFEKNTNNIQKTVNKTVNEIVVNNKIEILLTPNLTFEELMENLLIYEYKEGDLKIPKDQFGLGYTNLVIIIAELIDHMVRYPRKGYSYNNSKINLICIEEPETYMHPQLQELFIKNINKALKILLKKEQKNINSQLIITTHSSHILHSKIHSGNTFNNINYLTSRSNYSVEVICLKDGEILKDLKSKFSDDEHQKAKQQLQFLKKHIKYKTSELFFSDAVILVEGPTEEILLRYYIDMNEKLNKQYITIFNIDGNHGKVYYSLLKILKIPSLIITDIDLIRKNDDLKQVTEDDLENIKTSNETIKFILKMKKDVDKLYNLKSLIEDSKFEDGNICITYQNKIKGYIPTSFEEALILQNYKNRILNQVLEEIMPNFYKEKVGNNKVNKVYKNNLECSYEWQVKLGKNNFKTKFVNLLLYYCINTDKKSQIPKLPLYINEGLKWLDERLNGGENRNGFKENTKKGRGNIKKNIEPHR